MSCYEVVQIWQLGPITPAVIYLQDKKSRRELLFPDKIAYIFENPGFIFTFPLLLWLMLVSAKHRRYGGGIFLLVCSFERYLLSTTTPVWFLLSPRPLWNVFQKGNNKEKPVLNSPVHWTKPDSRSESLSQDDFR